MSRRFLFVALTLFALGCFGSPFALGPEYDAYEAVVRQQAERVHPPAGRQPVIYLDLDRFRIWASRLIKRRGAPAYVPEAPGSR